MTEVEAKLERSPPPEPPPAVVVKPASSPVRAPRHRLGPVLLTLAMVAVAAVFGWWMWQTYMLTPWTRDGVVRTYVVTIAPEVAGRVVKLPVVDNQFVHKGELLTVIDPTDYKVSVALSEAAVRQAQADADNVDAQIAVQQAQVSASQAQVESAQATLTFAQQQAARYRDLAQKEVGTVQMEQQTASSLGQAQASLKNTQSSLMLAQRQVTSLKAQLAAADANIARAKAQLDQAKVNLGRTQIESPVNGWVTNLLVQLGDYATVGRMVLSIVDADAFWVDAYFEETQLAGIRDGDPARIKLMGYRDVVRGTVAGTARGINVANARADEQGLATVNPIFTWVRLAQRVPVRIKIDHVPEGVRLVAGMTATVQVDTDDKRR